MYTPARTAASIGLAAILFIAAGCGSDSGSDVTDEAEDAVEAVEDEQADVARTLRDNGLDTVATALETIDVSQLTDSDDFTFFAPNDEAFQALTADELADLLADPDQVLNVLRNHTVADRLLAADLDGVTTAESEAGNMLDISTTGGSVMVGEATVVATDIDVADGVVHVVDRLLLP